MVDNEQAKEPKSLEDIMVLVRNVDRTNYDALEEVYNVVIDKFDYIIQASDPSAAVEALMSCNYYTIETDPFGNKVSSCGTFLHYIMSMGYIIQDSEGEIKYSKEEIDDKIKWFIKNIPEHMKKDYLALWNDAGSHVAMIIGVDIKQELKQNGIKLDEYPSIPDQIHKENNKAFVEYSQNIHDTPVEGPIHR